ncbi:MAG: putative phosphotransacetylase [Bacillota bacterium]|jgi:putative phosphotransacetylase|nr:putative phosphotransacetylase [Bacillota bacterium]MDK2784931.1 putative phosphotransacetylase [Bacillota bacterium]MDK2882906.1 putative phosphotransacetylase [Bacillota bacterium]
MAENESLVAQVVAAVLARLNGQPAQAAGASGKLLIPVGVSARHVHLSPEDVAELFGPGYSLTPKKPLQPGQYAAEETVTLVGPKGVLTKVRVLGPPRGHTQVEVSVTDCFTLGIPPVVRASGHITGTPGITVVGPKGARFLREGVIVALRHIHITPAEAATWGLKDGDMVEVAASAGDRALTFAQVLVRVSAASQLELHIDTDEANAAGLKSGDYVELKRSGERRGA